MNHFSTFLPEIAELPNDSSRAIESWSLWNMMPLRIPSRRTHRCRYCKLLRGTRAWLTVWVYLFRCAWLLLTNSLVKHNGSSQMEIKMDVIDVIALNSGIQVKDANERCHETSWNRGNHQCQKRLRGLAMGPSGPLGSLQVACRICLAREGELLAPCPCRGSLRLAHLECLKKERWQKWLFDWSYLELERSKKKRKKTLGFFFPVAICESSWMLKLMGCGRVFL